MTAEWGVNNTNASAWRLKRRTGRHQWPHDQVHREDSQYTVLRHVQAVNKLINLDKVFLMIANGGTLMNNATLPTQIEKGVANIFR